MQAVDLKRPRIKRAADRRLVRAFAFSLAVHLALFSFLEVSNRVEWLRRSPLARWLREAVQQPSVSKPETPKPPAREVPLLFVDVSPEQATPEPPPESVFYSTRNSQAANPDPGQDPTKPKIDGEQTKIVKTFDTLRPQPPAPAPEPPPAPERPPPEKPAPASEITTPTSAESRPAATTVAGDLTFAPPNLRPRPDVPVGETTPPPRAVPPSPPPRPRTVAEAKRQQGVVVSPKMKQEGGVRRMAIVPSLDVRATPFAAYDEAIIAAVQQRWYDLLDERRYAGAQEGKVVLKFRLNHDGRISDMKTAETSVDELLTSLCQLAVLNPSPYAPWPSDLRRLLSGNYRDVQFTFYY